MKIGVVIPTLNQRAFLAETLASILQQQGDFSLQAFVIDGESTDGTLDDLRQQNDPRVQWISEADRGQSHAINKGLAMASEAGVDVIGWLNSDDLYVPGAVEAVVQAFASHPSAQWLIGQCDMIDGAGHTIRTSITRYKNYLLRRYTHRRQLRQNSISQPAVFWRATFGQQVGMLDESLHYTMDYDLWLRMGSIVQPLILHRPLARFRLHDQSKSGARNRRQFDEGYEVACRYLKDDRVSRCIHRFHVEKIVLAYRLMGLAGF